MDSGENQRKDPPLYTLTAGSIAGAIEAVITYPTEFVKTQLQLQNGSKGAAPKGAAVSRVFLFRGSP